LEGDLDNEDEGGVPDDEEPDSLQPPDTVILLQMIPDTDIGYDEDADDDLEAPVDDVFVGEDDDHEEDDEGQRDEELLLYVLHQLDEMMNPRVSLIEIGIRYFLIFGHLFLID
jgi:hypothetical protein